MQLYEIILKERISFWRKKCRFEIPHPFGVRNDNLLFKTTMARHAESYKFAGIIKPRQLVPFLFLSFRAERGI